MVDNLFIVESPLQALVAAELSLQFAGQKNGIVYRLSGKERVRNDEQIISVIELGKWSFRQEVRFSESSALLFHIDARKCVLELRRRFRNNVQNLFFGDFRSRWMHLVRLNLLAERNVLMDDGAATLVSKKRHIDRGVFYPRELWKSQGSLNNLVKNIIYFGLVDESQALRPVSLASAFLKDESVFRVDFLLVRKKLGGVCKSSSITSQPKAYFFGSKYSEAGIISREYELEFLCEVFSHFNRKGLGVVYCAHRDESNEKIKLISTLGAVEVVRPSLPAELFVLGRDKSIAEIGAAYSSVVNNLSVIFPDKPIISFRLNRNFVNPRNRDAIDRIYQFFDQSGILVKAF